MKIQGLNIAMAQVNPCVGDVSGNARIVLDILRSSPVETDLVVFPELVLSGYPPEDLILKPSFLDALEKKIEALLKASESFGPGVILTAPYRLEGKVYNAAYLIHAGRIIGTTLKHHLPNYGVFDETRIFSSGSLPMPLPFKRKRLGVMICEDMWYGDVSAHLKKNGADILIVPNGSPYESQKETIRLFHARSRVEETGLPLVYVNQVGGQDDLVFDGGSFILNSKGELIQRLPFFEDNFSDEKDPIARSMDQNEKDYRALCLGMQDYVAKNNFPGVIIGLSGGIDSAISAAIAVDALGADRVRCVMMPSRFTSQDSLDDAMECATRLGVSYEVISIEPAMETFEKTLPSLEGLAHENMQSRCRGLILMALSNTSGWMVITTGNKSEMATGYATLYGDMCGGFNPIKDVYKTRVYDLCQWRNGQNKGKTPPIPERILTKAPSAELRDNQKDEDSLPPYPILDVILNGLVEQEKTCSALAKETGYPIELIKKISRLLDRAEYKRKQSAPGVKITPRAFGRDRRYPITNQFSEQIEK